MGCPSRIILSQIFQSLLEGKGLETKLAEGSNFSRQNLAALL